MKQLINNKWYFWDKDDSFSLIWNISENAQIVDLPFDPMAMQIPDRNSINGGSTGFIDGGVYYFVKNIKLSERNKLHFLEFEGIAHNAMIYINGQFAGENKFGYNKFRVEISDYIEYDQENEIRVVVRNNNQSSRWYHGGGIYRNVYLDIVDPVYIDKVNLTTIDATPEIATIELDIKIVNRMFTKQIIELLFNLGDIEVKYPLFINGNDALVVKKQLTINRPSLWNADNPHLYDYIIKISNETYVEEKTGFFGIRKINFNATQGLLINGNVEKLRGACIHSDSGILGAKSYYDYEYYRISALKKAGFNAIRMSHNPTSTDLLNVCDKLGMYIMEETFDMWHRSKSDYDFSQDFSKHYKDEINLMINNAYNHPAVIMYSLGNEIPDIGMDKGIETLSQIAQFVKKLDGTRPTLLSINGVFAAGNQIGKILNDVLEKNGDFSGNVNNFMQVMDKYMDDIVIHSEINKIIDRVEPFVDILGYNYMSNRYQLEINKNRIIVGSETYPPQIGNNWKQVKKLNNVIGDFTWTGWDYIGEAGVGIPAYKFGDGGFGAQYPARLAYCGDFDLIGTRRPLSYYREIVFGQRQDPYITIINPNHNTEDLIKTPWVMSDALASYYGEENQTLDLEIYSPGDEVDIYVNDEYIATSQVKNNIACAKINYKEGFVRVVSFQNRVELGSYTLYSQNDDTNLDVKIISGNSKQLTFVQITNNCGSQVSYKPQEINIVADNVLGIGNGDPKNVNSYGSTQTYTYNGHAMIILKYGSKEIEINGIKYSIKEK